jgi:hypothetical protein
MQKPVTLTHAQQLAWLHQDPAPATSREALGRLQETIHQCVAMFEAEQVITAQTLLEDSLIQTLVAMRSLGIQPEQALRRTLNRLQGASGQRAFHIFPDRVEIRAQGELRGEWPLFSQADYEAALRLARELGCDVIHEEASQLGLFARV